jgi:NADH-quinone oxidoreductase subunit C
MSKKILECLEQQFGKSVVLETHSACGDDTAVVLASHWFEVASFLRNNDACAMDMLIDLCGADYPNRSPRLELVVHLRSSRHGHRLRLKTRIGDEDCNNASVHSLVALWQGANWFERETFDMFGIKFEQHPDLRRIFLYEEFEGHPLRKDYPAAKTQPLVPYREGDEVLDKLPPFGPDMGMSFGRKHLDYTKRED